MITTKQQALETYRYLKGDPNITMTQFFAAMGRSRMTLYNWPEELNRDQQRFVNGFLLELESDPE